MRIASAKSSCINSFQLWDYFNLKCDVGDKINILVTGLLVFTCFIFTNQIPSRIFQLFTLNVFSLLWKFSSLLWNFSSLLWNFSSLLWNFSSLLWNFSSLLWNFSKKPVCCEMTVNQIIEHIIEQITLRSSMWSSQWKVLITCHYDSYQGINWLHFNIWVRNPLTARFMDYAISVGMRFYFVLVSVRSTALFSRC